MSLYRTYNLKCDGCGAIHKTTCATPRRARAVAKSGGWQRRKVVVGKASYIWQGLRVEYDDIRGRDFCPTCSIKEPQP